MAQMNGSQWAKREASVRRVVCRRCGVTMTDAEPYAGFGEFSRPRRQCSNSGKCFTLASEHAREVAPFESKRIRRAAKAGGDERLNNGRPAPWKPERGIHTRGLR